MATKPTLSRIWSRVTGIRVLVFGDLILEKHIRPDRGGADAGSLPTSGDEVRPGGAAAVAALAACLGAEINVAGIIGDDSGGRTLLRLLEEARVGHALVSASAGYSTLVAERSLRGSEEGVTARLSSSSCPRRQCWPPSLKEKLVNVVTAEIGQYDLLLIPDDGCGACRRDVLTRLMTVATSANVMVCVDCRRTRDFSRYAGASLIQTSRSRAEFIVGRDIITSEDALEAGREICRRWGFLTTMITLGREGMALVEAVGDQLIVPTTPQEVFEKTGARQVALAVIGICLAQGTCGPDAVRLANLATGLEIQRLGIAPISHDELYRAALMSERDQSAGASTSLLVSKRRRRIEKQVTARRLLRAAATHREQGHRIALVAGRFDPLDASVVSMLKAATNHAEVIIACVLGDAGAPLDNHIFGADSRARMLSTLPWVDYVVFLPHRDWGRFAEKLRPDRTFATDAAAAKQFAELTNDNDTKARSHQP